MGGETLIQLHTIRCWEPKKVDACFKYIFCKTEKFQEGFFLCLVFFAENLSLMVKTVECIGYFINVCTDLMRCFFFESILNGTSEFCQLQHKVLLACIDSRKDFSCFKVSTFFFITIENGFDTNDRRACQTLWSGWNSLCSRQASGTSFHSGIPLCKKDRTCKTGDETFFPWIWYHEWKRRKTVQNKRGRCYASGKSHRRYWRRDVP